MADPAPVVRKGQTPDTLTRDAFFERFRHAFADPAFDREREALRRIEVIAWEAYQQSRKSPRTRQAGPGFADPRQELSVGWLETRERLRLRLAAQRRQLPGRDVQDLAS
jgi:hypothetical protein